MALESDNGCTPTNGTMRTDPWSLSGETALVTGATRGIGRAIAEELARLGAEVYVCARTEEDLLQRLAAWKSQGLDIHGSACDVSLLDSRLQLMSRVKHHFLGKLSILVNNVGIGGSGAAEAMPMEEFSKPMDVNVHAGFHLSQLAYPLFKARGKGSIVFVSSIGASSVLMAHHIAYAASKAAENQLAKQLAFEWAKDNIRVNAVAPGYTMTEMLKQYVSAETVNLLEQRIPLRRLATVAEIAYAVAFLCMPCSSYVAGSVLTVDGGMSTHLSPFPCA